MCGSVALIKERTELEATVRSALRLLESRGPDGSGVSVTSVGALGHCRLSLRDFAGGSQPLALADGRTLAYVGELYNDVKLRQILQLSGWSPQNASDTEVLAKAIEQWGDEVWTKLEAMFAVMLLSADGTTLKLVRDRFGVKPIFYGRNEQSVVAASQPAALVELGYGAAASREAIVHFLTTSQVCFHGQTLFADMKIAPQGATTTLSLESANQTRWAKDFNFETPEASELNPPKLTYLLGEAVYRQSQADFPVGVFLSGGVDSSILAALLALSKKQPIRTFAVAFDGDTEDLEYARLVAAHVRSIHTEKVVSPSEFFSGMRELTLQRALPVSLPNEVLIYKLSQTAKSSVKAVLSGEGADELFGGYQKLHARLQSSNTPQTDMFKLYRASTSWFTHADLFESLVDCSAVSTAKELDQTELQKLVSGIPREHVVRSLLLKDHFAHLLLRLDGAAMAGSIEGRVPFTDSDVVQYALGLSNAQLAPTFGLEKPVLRKACMGLLPEEVLRRPKRAFHASFNIIFESEAGQQELFSALRQPLIAKLFNQEKLERILIDDRETQVFHRTWLICSLGMWSELCRVSEIS
ncbi:MAG: asparagine synthase (glutamine-hydrolyzing) [bacterium]|nr:asparagine synthase (glutamine-hydrolyzing) [bacterium]